MTRRERVQTALRHERPEVCPWYLEMVPSCRQDFLAWVGDPNFEARVGNHLARVRPRAADYFVEVSPGFFRDEFGVVWDRRRDPDFGNPHGVLLAQPDLRGYRWPDPALPARWRAVERQIAEAEDKFVLLGMSHVLFERAWFMRGLENLLLDMYERPEFVEGLLDALVDHHVQLIEQAAAYPVDAYYFGDDYGSQAGLLISPALWRRFLKPRLARLCEAAEAQGRHVLLHSCGAVGELVGDLVEIGVEGLNPCQPEAMDLPDLHRRYGRELIFFGGLSTQRTLAFGTPEEVKAETWALIRELGAEGGYLCSPAQTLPKGIPPSNILAFVEAVQDQSGVWD